MGRNRNVSVKGITEQGTRPRGIRHVVQQARLRGRWKHFWSFNYVQHSAHIEPGRDGLFNFIKDAPASLMYEPGVIVAGGNFVIVHGRFSGTGCLRDWIAADVVRIADGVLAEHWDVFQDEVTRAESKNDLPMVDTQFRE
jgi:predicted SnoaL-like aldol condensation-catalyzing enzyme